MTEIMNVSSTIDAPAEQVFAVLADPTSHQAIDGTGWVRESLDGELTETGQIFRVAMYHDNHPDGDYEMANKVITCKPGRAIGWEPGQADEDGTIEFGGWIWHYDLEAVNPQQTRVTLTYDWSAVLPMLREQTEFPPFPLEHLENSLENLAKLAAVRK